MGIKLKGPLDLGWCHELFFRDDDFTMYIYTYLFIRIWIWRTTTKSFHQSVKISKRFHFPFDSTSTFEHVFFAHRGTHARSLLDGVQVVLYISTMVPQDIACAPWRLYFVVEVCYWDTISADVKCQKWLFVIYWFCFGGARKIYVDIRKIIEVFNWVGMFCWQA